MYLFVVDGIKYHKIGSDPFYAHGLFGYLQENMVVSQESNL